MLRHWAHSKICKEIRAARCIVVDRILSEHDLEWRDVPNLDISDENYEGHGEQLGDEMEESSLIDVRLLFTDGNDPTGDGLYPAVTSEGLLFSEAAREALGEYVETNDPYVVDVKSDIADVQREFLRKFDPLTDEPPIKFRNRNQKGALNDVDPSDLIDILEFGIEVGLSNAQGDKLITLIKRLFGRRNIPIQLRNEYESMKLSLKTNVTAPMFPIQRFVYPLPEEYFGDTDPATGTELKAIESVALNPINALADSLLRIENPGNFLTSFESQFVDYDEGVEEPPREHHVEELPRQCHILGDFRTGDLWRKVCADARRYRCSDPDDPRQIVYLLLGV